MKSRRSVGCESGPRQSVVTVRRCANGLSGKAIERGRQARRGTTDKWSLKAHRHRSRTRSDCVRAIFDQSHLQFGQERGYVTYGEIDAVLPMDQTSSEQIEDAMTVLSELGINVIEDDDTVETSVSPADGDATEVRGNIGEDIGGSDDPVRMYLREMGSLGLLSREGEVAIAKRIEIGRRTMVGGICESPLTVRALMLWRDSLNQGKLLLRDIIDLDAMYSSANLLLADADAAIPPRVVAAEAGEREQGGRGGKRPRRGCGRRYRWGR